MNEQPAYPQPFSWTLELVQYLIEAARPPAPFAHSRVFADKQLIQRAGVYHGGVLKATSGGASSVDIYDGLEASGEPIDRFLVAASGHERHVYERGIALQVGLYIDLGSNVDFFTAYYDPVPREKG